MPKLRPFSKLKKQIEKLFVPELKMTVHCLSYPVRSQYGSSSIPRFYVKLGKDIIWDFPKDFPIKEINYHWWKDENHISELIREYINAPIIGLLMHKFDKDTIKIQHHFPKFPGGATCNWDDIKNPNYELIDYDFKLGLIDLFRAADRRFGKNSLKRWAAELNNPKVNLILERRLQLDEDLKPGKNVKKMDICKKCGAINQLIIVNVLGHNTSYLHCTKCNTSWSPRTWEEVKLDLPTDLDTFL